MDTRPIEWITTGIFWDSSSPVLALADRAGNPNNVPVAPGDRVAVCLGGPRRCVGWWLPEAGRRRPCPQGREIAAAGGVAQCETCSASDPGRAFARDEIHDDGRRHALYLAWFGPQLLKVGMTAVERGADRLAEQGAIAYVWIGSGSRPAVRHLEQRVSAARIAPQRRRRPEKVTAWWSPSSAASRAGELATARRLVQGLASDDITPLGPEVHDNFDQFGIASLPDSYDELTDLAADAALVGTVLIACGRDLLIDLVGAGPTLVDSRLLAGRPTSPAIADRTAGIVAVARTRPRSPDADDTLF
ncbi:DUF2797 domain-containing protein [Kribbella sp. NPDC059898]|uniref:DUF2797 domain-containing protein n=1 Tax=Kribbella sp. NPDC059898 TaxID=3346995 RepID=UPI003651D25F